MMTQSEFEAACAARMETLYAEHQVLGFYVGIETSIQRMNDETQNAYSAFIQAKNSENNTVKGRS